MNDTTAGETVCGVKCVLTKHDAVQTHSRENSKAHTVTDLAHRHKLHLWLWSNEKLWRWHFIKKMSPTSLKTEGGRDREHLCNKECDRVMKVTLTPDC